MTDNRTTVCRSLKMIILILVIACFSTMPCSAQQKNDLKTLFYEGSTLMSRGDYQNALAKFQQGLNLSRKLGNSQAECVFLGNIGLIRAEMGDRIKAVEFTKMAEELAKKNNDAPNELAFSTNMGGILMKFKEYDSALAKMEYSLTLAVKLSNRLVQSDILNKTGKIYFYKGNMEKALTLCKESLKLSKEIKNIGAEMNATKTLGDINYNLGRYQEALDLYRNKHKLSITASLKNEYVSDYIKMGNALIKTGQYSEALELIKKAAAIADTPQEKETATGNLGSILLEMGDLTEAKVSYEKAIEQAGKTGSKINLPNWYSGLGTVFQRMGEYKKAIDFHEQAQKTAIENGDRHTLSQILSNYGATLMEIGEYKKAIDILRNTSLQVEDIAAKAAIYENIGISYLKKGEPDAAIQYFDKSSELFKTIGDRHREGIHLINKGNMFSQKDENDKAILCYQQALQLAQENNDERRISIATGNMGIVEWKKGKYDEAISMLDKAIKISGENEDRNGLFRWYYYKGLSFTHLRKNKPAIESLKKAIDILEELRGEIKFEEFKTSFITQYLDVYEVMIELLIEENKIQEAFEYAERSKARNFLDSIGNRKIIPGEAGDRQLADDEAKLLAKIRYLEKMLENTKGKDQKAIKSQIRALRNEHDLVLEKLIISNPEYASVMTVKPASLKEIQNSLSDDEQILEYYTGQNQIFVWLVTKDNIYFYSTRISSDNLSDIAASLRQSVMKADDWADGDDTGIIDKQCREKLTETGKLVIPDDLQKKLSQIEGRNKTLIIVPHGCLHYVPFSCLINSEGKYLVENFSILNEPSASSMVLFRKRSNVRNKSLECFALGDGEESNSNKTGNNEEISDEIISAGLPPLPGTKEEVDQIAKIFERNSYTTEKHIGKQFTVKKAEEKAGQGGYIHFATHGILSEKSKGRFSGLVASDGYIYIADIFNWKLNADLVTLSACQTGMGRLSGGEDMVGLSRAFMQAGTDNLMATLWSVSDESTRDFMIEYYKELLAGRKKHEALRNAQLTTMKKYPHPFFWAPFIVFGKGN